MNASLDEDGHTLRFAPALNDPTASENTIDHYIVYLSPDQQQLLPMSNLPRGSRAQELAAYQLSPGTYWAYVQSIGTPLIFNHLSPSVRFTIH